MFRKGALGPWKSDHLLPDRLIAITTFKRVARFYSLPNFIVEFLNFLGAHSVLVGDRNNPPPGASIIVVQQHPEHPLQCPDTDRLALDSPGIGFN